MQESLIRLMKLTKAIDILSNIEFDFDDDYEFMWHDSKVNKKFHKLYHEFYTEHDQLINAGIIVKDVELGIVDFFSMHKGKEIYLCYRLGESTINYWHHIEGDFKTRKHVSELEIKKIK